MGSAVVDVVLLAGGPLSFKIAPPFGSSRSPPGNL